MKKFLALILILGTFTGIIPILLVSVLSRHITLMVTLIVTMLIWISKEICE